ncbi:MAG: 3'-5' exonuclease [Leptospiraceae bacterium]|nr:3'-5' exonuclease [Leptospiraceae bacterium]
MLFESKKLRDSDFVSLDIETTGLSPKNSQVLEIGLLHFSKDRILGDYRTYIKPQKFQNGAVTVNGITEDLLENAPTLEDVASELFPILRGKPLVIQNAEFDLSFLLNDVRTVGLFEDSSPVYCTLQLSRKYFPGLPSYSLDSLRKKFYISEFQKSRGGIAHEALDDCFAAMKVFIECANQGNLWESDSGLAAYHQKNLKIIYDYKRKLI